MRRALPFLAILLFFYLLFDVIVQMIPMDELLRKSLVVNNLLVYSPLATFFVAAYAGLYGFSRRFVLLATLMFFVTILTFGEWILLYHVAYFICLLVGTLLGYGVFRWRK